MVKSEKLLEILNSHKFDDLKKAIEENIREENYKNAGKKSTYNAIIKRLVKDTEKNNKRIAGVHHFNLGSANYQGITNGHYILATSGNLSMADCDNQFDMSKIFKDCNNHTTTIKVELEKMRVYSKMNKDKYKPFIIDIDNDSYVGINASYLCDILDFCNSDTIYINSEYIKPGCYKSTIFIKSADMVNISMILPVNVLDVEKIRAYINNLLSA